MYWSITSLDPAFRSRLADVSRRGGLESGLFCFQPGNPRNGLLLGAILGLPASGGGAVMLGYALTEPTPAWGIALVAAGLFLAGSWTFLVVLELIRGGLSPIKPFRLLTPRAIVRCDYAHGRLHARLLRDATKFSSVDQHDTRTQKWSGRAYDFRFLDGQANFVVKTPADVALVDRILAQARDGSAEGSAGADLVPPSGGSAQPRDWRGVTNPFGTFWAGVLGVLIILFFIGIIAGRMFGR